MTAEMLYPHRRLSVIWTLFALYLIVVGSPVYGSDPYDEIGRIMDRAEFSIAERNDIREVFQNAADADIPRGLLVSRLQEGVSKRVGPPRIVSALRTDIDQLLQAREIAHTVPGGAELLQEPNRWARALTVIQAGYGSDEFHGLVQVTVEHPERFRSAAALFVSLRDWGLDHTGAIRIVDAAVRSSLPPLDYPGIAEILAAGRRERVRPAEMVDRIVSALQTSDTLSALRRRVLQ